MQRICLLCVGSALVSLCPELARAAATYYVATTGSDSAAGTEAAPFATVNHANSVASAGDTIYIHGGTYPITAGTNSCASQTDTVNAIALSKSGAAGNLIKYWAVAGETPVFDYTNLMADCRVKGFLVSGSYIHLKGIEVTGVKQRNQANHESWGVWISGSNNIFEQLDIHHIDGTGLFIGKGGGNLVLNCDSHHNFDPLTSNGACESGDGFGAHIPAGGTGNVFRGCRAWFNSDDDFDLINAFESVTIENCWGWHAGYRYDTGAGCGNGNGFKSGGYGTDTSTFPANPPVHVIRNNLAVGNRAAGFYANHHPGKITFYNNTSYGNNPDFNMLGMSTSGADITVGTYRNNLAVGSKLTSNANGADDTTNSWTLSVTANDADFILAAETGLDGPRQADGSLPAIDNFHLVAGSDLIDKGVDVGLPFSGAQPDLGCFETGMTSTAGGSTATGGAKSGGATSTDSNTARGGSGGRSGTPLSGAGRSGIASAAMGGTSASGGAPASSKGGATPVNTPVSGGAPTSQPLVGGGVATSSVVTAQGGSATSNATTSGSATTGEIGGTVTSAPATGASVSTGGASHTAQLSAGSGSASPARPADGCNCRHTSGNASSLGSVAYIVLLGLVRIRRWRLTANRAADRA